MKTIKEKQTNDDIKVSVLVSTYNKEEFIAKTIDSIVNQTMSNNDFELIVVDDCSTDNTLDVVSNAVEDLANYKIVQLDQNSGTPAEPRNLAIDLSVGDYITFIDGDDWLPEDSLEKLYNLLIENGTDYATGLTKYMYNDRSARSGVALSKIAHNKLDLKKHNIRQTFYHLAPPGRMIKADVIKKNNLRFAEMIFAEDLQFFAEVLFNVDTISTTSDVVYLVNRYSDNVSLVKSAESTTLNRMKLQTKAYRFLANKYKDNPLFKDLLIRIINKDILSGKFYKKAFIENIDILLPAFQDTLNAISEDFDPLNYTDDELNQHAVELIQAGDKAEIIDFVKWYLTKDKKKLKFSNHIAYYPYHKKLYKVLVYSELVKVTEEKGGLITLTLYSKNSNLKYLEAKSRTNPSDYAIVDIKKSFMKPGYYTVKFKQTDLPSGKIALTVMNQDLQATTIRTKGYFNMYTTIGKNLGLINK